MDEDDGAAFTFGKRGIGKSNYLGHFDTAASSQPKRLKSLSQAQVLR
jgi:hypothetical protein